MLKIKGNAGLHVTLLASKQWHIGSKKILHSVGQTGAICAAFTGLFFAAGFVGFQQLFSSFASYDDEGYVMLSLRMYLAGRPLYDDIFTQYGPAYYVTQAVFHGFSGLPVTHDVARWKTLMVWLATSGMAAAYVQRMTRYPWLSALAFLMVFFHLDRLGLEPGHPQDVCLPAMMALLLLSTYLREAKTNHWLLATFGGLLGLIATTKLNLGVFCGLSLSLTLLAITRQSLLRKILLATFIVGALALPFVLLKHHAFTLTGARLPSLVVVGTVGLILALRSHAEGALLLRNLWGVLIVAGIVAVLFLVSALWNGTSLSGLYWGMIGQHAGFAADCYAHPPLEPLSLVWAAIALVVVLRRPPNNALTGWLLAGCGILLVVLQRRHFGESFSPVQHGLYDRGLAGLLATIATPLACLPLIPFMERERDERENTQRFPRWLLAWSIVLQPLAVIPVPGTQLAIGTLPALLMLFVVGADVIERMRREGSAFQHIHPNGYLKAFVAFAIFTLACRGWMNCQQRSKFEPLALPGASLLRLPRDEVVRLRSTVGYLREKADTFVTLPCGFDSLYLWSELPPPTGFNVTVWDVLLDDRRQQAIIDALKRAHEPRLVVYTNWPPVNRANVPLVKYLRETFTHCEVDGMTQIWAKENAAE